MAELPIAEQQEEDLTSDPEQDLLQQFSAVDEDGNTVVLTAEAMQSLEVQQENEGLVEVEMEGGGGDVEMEGDGREVEMEGDEREVGMEGDGREVEMEGHEGEADTEEFVEEIIGGTEEEGVDDGNVVNNVEEEEEEEVITQTIVDEDGNQQLVTGPASAIQDLITLHGIDADGNIMTARAPGEVDSADEDLENVDISMDQSTMESMMDTENIVEEVITGNNDDERYSLTANESLPPSSDISSRAFLNVQEAIFNPATGTLQPISSVNNTNPPKPVAVKTSKKKQNQQPVTKYVIAQQSGDMNQPQQIILDAQSLQGLLQGGGNTITFSGASGKQSIFLAPQTQSAQKGKTSKSPAKILPAPVPIGDQQQASTQRFLLKQGTVLTPISQMSQGGTTTKLIQMPSTGANQPIQYLRVVQKQQQIPSNKVPIAPATYKPKPVAPKPAPGQQQTIFTLPSGATADLSSFQNAQGLGNFVVLPNYVVKSEHNTPVPIRPAHDVLQSGMSETAAILGGMSQNVSGHGSYESFRSLLEPNGMRPRKPCNCTKSQCLKLYCDCFANGEFCHLCNCTNCYNNLNHEEDRQKAIKLVLERNPGAFRPKIGKSSQTGEAHERRHNKGCNCRRSGCLKNYCECYEAKIFCSGICKCTGCKNCIENIPSGLPNGVGVEQHFAGAGTSHRQTLKDLAEAAEVRVQQQTQVKNKMKAQMQEVSPQNNLGIMVPPVVFRYPHGSVSYDVVTSTVEVLLAKAEAIERQRMPDGELEKAILEEFGDCLSALMELGNTVGIHNNFN